MADYKTDFKTNISQSHMVETNKAKNLIEKREKSFRYTTKNIISKRILIFLFILYMNINLSISANQFVSIKMKNGDNKYFINPDFKKYILEIHINDEKIPGIFSKYVFVDEEITVKVLFNSTINNCSGMFKDCSNILEIDFTNFDSSNITHLSETFKGCNNLKSIDLSNWDISRVTSIDNLFKNCVSLTSIELPNFKGASITSMNGVFNKCQKLNSLDFSRIDTSQVTSMEYMFSECGTLTS